MEILEVKTNYIYEKIINSKYVLYFRTNNIYQYKTFNNRLKLRNFITENNIVLYYIKQNY